MIRLAVSSALLLGAGCATAPSAPEELIVGKWACSLSNLTPDSRYLMTFTKDGRVSFELDATSTGTGPILTMKMDVTGSYRLEDGALSGAFEDATIHYLAINGEALPAERLPAFEQGLVKIAKDAVDSTIDVLDSDKLILGPSNEGTSISCKRLAA